MQRPTWKVVGQSCRYRLGPMCVEVGNWLHQAGEWCKLEGLMCWRWERVPLRCEIIEHSGSCLYRKSQRSNLLYKKNKINLVRNILGYDIMSANKRVDRTIRRELPIPPAA